MKILWIVALVGLLIYYIGRRLFMGISRATSVSVSGRRGFQLVDTHSALMGRVTRNTFSTVGFGIALLFVILILGFKIKIILIALPLSFYLIGQFFVYNNQLRLTKDQKLYFDAVNNDVCLARLHGGDLYFNLLNDVAHVVEVKSVQMNRGVLFGYYKIQLKGGQMVAISHLLSQNENRVNSQFFERLQEHFKAKVETKLFPMA